MRAIGIVGSSSLEKRPFVAKLIAAYRDEGWSVSVVKRAPDGFDIDRPGKDSYVRREAGALEVMLVGDRRFVLMRELREEREPTLEWILSRLEPADIVIVEGFHGMAIPTLEVHRPSRGRAPRWPLDRRIVAVASDEAVQSPLPTFSLDDVAGIARFMAEQVGLLRAVPQ